MSPNQKNSKKNSAGANFFDYSNLVSKYLSICVFLIFAIFMLDFV